MILAGIVLLYLAFHATPASAQNDCDPFEGGTPQSSKKCPCSDDPNSRYYCASAVQYTVFEITEKVRALFLSILETIARVLWLAARIIANLAEAMLRGQIWQAIRQGLLVQLQSVMGGSGGVLAKVVGGGNGLFLVALLLAGLVMVFPLLGASRLVQPDRVILWGVVLFALFIGGTQGFDLTNAIESLRVHMIETIAEGQDQDGLINLVALPVGATPDEARQLDTNDLMTLPQVMVQDHFIGLPEGSRCRGEGGGADECQKYRVIAFETNIAGQDLEYMFTAVKYKPDVIDGRQKQYTSGVVRMVVTLLAALVLLLFGMVFALLTAASLVLIIFFVAMLPLGFFEFGSVLLTGLMRQYTSVVGLSLFAAVMVRLMGGITGTIFGAMSDFSDVLGLLTYLGMLLIVGLGLQMAVRTAWGLMDGTFTVLSASVQTVGSMAFAVGGGPLGGITHMGASKSNGKAASNTASNTAVNAALTAGAGLAGGGLGNSSRNESGEFPLDTKINSQVADMKATQFPKNLRYPLFSATARETGNRNSNTSLSNMVKRWRGSSQGNLRDESTPENALIQSKWGMVTHGGFLTPDQDALTAAETAYFEQQNVPQARAELERTFDSRAMADEVLGVYEIQGKAGAEQVSQVVEITHAVVDDLIQHGQAIFDERGGLTSTCESAVLGNLHQAGLYNEHDPHQSAFVGRLAGAVFRNPVNVWDDPQAPLKLARDTFDPEHAEVQIDDLAAQYRLRDTVTCLGWDEDQLTYAFAALPQAEQRSVRDSRPVVDELLEEWRSDPQFAGEEEAALREAARLVVLVGSQAKVQKFHSLPEERPDRMPPVVEMNHEAGGIVVSAPYSARLNQQFKDHLPTQDYYWDVDRTEWKISSGHEAAVRNILDQVAKANGWQIQEDEQAEDLPATTVESANFSEAIPVADTNNMVEPAPDHPFDTAQVVENGSQDKALFPDANNQRKDEPSVEPSLEPVLTEPNISGRQAISALRASPNIQTTVEPARRSTRSSRVLAVVAGKTQQDELQPVKTSGILPVPDVMTHSGRTPETPEGEP